MKAIWRRKLGSCRTERGLCNDVNVAAIPVLDAGFFRWGVDRISVGGDAPKVFITMSERVPFEHAYIAKAPRREGPRECVTEYLIASIGKTLPISIASGRLVRLDHRDGDDADVRYMSRYFLRRDEGEQLVHASQLAAKCLDMAEAELIREIPPLDSAEWQFYSLSIVDSILGETGREAADAVRDSFARMLAFDALVGANDRHAQNWGIIENARLKGPPKFAPIYDTARGLFWNHTDEKLNSKATAGHREAFIRQYAEKSASLIGVPQTAEKPNHFSIIEYVVQSSSDTYRNAVTDVIRAFRPDVVRKMLHERFGRLFSRIRLEFIDDLLRYRHARLVDILSGS